MEEYEVIEKLGRGNFGEVQKVKKVSSGQIMALKILRDPYIAKREIEVLRALNSDGCHPLILCYYGAIEIKNYIGILTEFVDGYTLSQMRRKTITDDQMLKLLEYVFDGLAYIHSKGIIHNDISPQNIMFGDQGLKIIDYGMSGFYRDDKDYEPEKITDNLFELETDELFYNIDLYPKLDVMNAGIMFWKLITPDIGVGKYHYFIGMTADYQEFIKNLAKAPNRLSYYTLHSSKILSELQDSVDKYKMDTKSEIVEQIIRMATRVDPYARPSASEIVNYIRTY